MNISRLLGAVCMLTISMVMPTVVNAVVIHESATLGTTGTTGGVNIASSQYIGSRFSITDTVSVDHIGGHIYQYASGDLFGAIVSLSGSTALPTGTPFDLGEIIASTTFTPSSTSDDILTPLSVTLTPGDYALVFGSGLFGATGGGGMLLNNSDILGTASYFFWSGASSTWTNGGFSNARFVVTGTTVVPIPPALWLFGSGLLGLVGMASRNKSA